jgi:Protein of unknown function (DUF998)
VTLGTVAISGTVWFVLAIAALHVLSPEIDPVHRPTSEYARGPFGYLMTSAFVSLSLATWALVVGLHRDLQSAGLHRAGLWFLAVWGAGLLVAATFPIDLDDAPRTLAGRIHTTNGPIIFLNLTIAINLVSRGFKHDVRWRPIHRFTSVLALLMIPEFVAGGLARARGTGAGIMQRAFIVTFATWFLVVATQLRSNAIRDASTR